MESAAQSEYKEFIYRYDEKFGQPLELTPLQLEYIVGYYAMALYGIVEKWFLRGMQDPVEDFMSLVQMMNTLNNFSLFNALEALANAAPTEA